MQLPRFTLRDLFCVVLVAALFMPGSVEIFRNNMGASVGVHTPQRTRVHIKTAGTGLIVVPVTAIDSTPQPSNP